MQNTVPHQRVTQIEEIVFDSKFPSGNLLRVEKNPPLGYNLWIGGDHEKSNYRTWFYFSVRGPPDGASVAFTIKNMSNQTKLLKQGLLPVYRNEGDSQWRRIRTPIQITSIVTTELGVEFTFKHTFENYQRTYFAFSYPWTLPENDKLLLHIQQQCYLQRLYFNRTVLTYTTQHRPIELITISHKENTVAGSPIEGVFPNGNIPHTFQKKGIFVSARVHPGEVPSSHVMNGILKYLVSQDQTVNALLKECVFYLVPVINPDGVDNGMYRSDSQGQNLNRHYQSPSPTLQPQIYGIKQFLTSMIDRNLIHCCLDLHAHAAKKGFFIYGNYVPDFNKQLDVCLFPKLLQLNNIHFDFDACNFTQKNMYSVDRGDTQSKEGAARVAIFKDTGLHACWTLECNYNTGRFTNRIGVKTELAQRFNINSINRKLAMEDPLLQNIEDSCELFTVNSFESLGQRICDAFADYFEVNVKVSRVNSSPFRNLKMLKLNIGVSMLRSVPFRFDNSIRKILTNLNNDDKINDNLMSLSRLIQDRNEQPKIVVGSTKVTLKPLIPPKGQKKTTPTTSKQLYDKRSGSIVKSIGRTNSILKRNSLDVTKRL